MRKIEAASGFLFEPTAVGGAGTKTRSHKGSQRICGQIRDLVWRSLNHRDTGTRRNTEDIWVFYN